MCYWEENISKQIGNPYFLTILLSIPLNNLPLTGTRLANRGLKTKLIAPLFPSNGKWKILKIIMFVNKRRENKYAFEDQNLSINTTYFFINELIFYFNLNKGPLISFNFLRKQNIFLFVSYQGNYSSIPNKRSCTFLFFTFSSQPVCLIWVYTLNRFSRKNWSVFFLGTIFLIKS